MSLNYLPEIASHYDGSVVVGSQSPWKVEGVRKTVAAEVPATTQIIIQSFDPETIQPEPEMESAAEVAKHKNRITVEEVRNQIRQGLLADKPHLMVAMDINTSITAGKEGTEIPLHRIRRQINALKAKPDFQALDEKSQYDALELLYQQECADMKIMACGSEFFGGGLSGAFCVEWKFGTAMDSVDGAIDAQSEIIVRAFFSAFTPEFVAGYFEATPKNPIPKAADIGPRIDFVELAMLGEALVIDKEEDGQQSLITPEELRDLVLECHIPQALIPIMQDYFAPKQMVA